LNERERAAIEAVARRFPGTWEKGSDRAGVHVMAGGKRIAVDIGSLGRRSAADANGGEPRLRFDKVATRVVERLRASLGERVPDDSIVLLTITAPIRVPAKTVAALEEKARALLGRGSARRAEKVTIHGNRVQIRLVSNEAARRSRVIGFVHNPDSDPHVLVAMTREWLELSSAGARKRGVPRAGHRWLVVVSPRKGSCLEAYRYIHAQLGTPIGFDRIVMVFGDGRVGVLAG